MKLGRPVYHPLLTDDGRINADLRDATRGRSGVYLLRPKGARQVTYVGSSVPQEKGGADEPRRLWKTILRHFQRCGAHQKRKRKRNPRYEFRSDNWCEHNAHGRYELAVLFTTPAEARAAEAAAIRRYKPTYQAEKSKQTRAPDPDAAPF